MSDGTEGEGSALLMPTDQSGAAIDGVVEVEVVPAAPAQSQMIELSGSQAADIGGELAKLAGKSSRRVLASRNAVYRLRPSAEMARGLQAKTLRYAAPTSGDASILIKEASGAKKIKGHAALERVRANPASVIGPAVWQAMALATQQHFLVEISGRLETIEQGVAELIDRTRDKSDSELDTLREQVRRWDNRQCEGIPLTAHQRHQVDQDLAMVDDIRRTALRPVRRLLAEAEEGKEVDPAKWAEDFELAYKATAVQAELAALKVRVPRASQLEVRVAIDEERDRAKTAIDELQMAATGLLAVSREWGRRVEHFERHKVKSVPNKTWNATIGGLIPSAHAGAVKPKHGPLDPAVEVWLERLTSPPSAQPQEVFIEVKRGRAVMHLPAAPRDRAAGELVDNGRLTEGVKV